MQFCAKLGKIVEETVAEDIPCLVRKTLRTAVSPSADTFSTTVASTKNCASMVRSSVAAGRYGVSVTLFDYLVSSFCICLASERVKPLATVTCPPFVSMMMSAKSKPALSETLPILLRWITVVA